VDVAVPPVVPWGRSAASAVMCRVASRWAPWPGINEAGYGAHGIRFDPYAVMEGAALPVLRRLRFLAMVSSAIRATFLARNSAGSPDGFGVAAPTAGWPQRAAPGANSDSTMSGSRSSTGPVTPSTPMRSRRWACRTGPPGVRDAGGARECASGGCGRHPGGYGVRVLRRVRTRGATQAFHRRGRDRRRDIRADRSEGVTDGNPFKGLEQPGTLSEEDAHQRRPRWCDIGWGQVRRDGRARSPTRRLTLRGQGSFRRADGCRWVPRPEGHRWSHRHVSGIRHTPRGTRSVHNVRRTLPVLTAVAVAGSHGRSR
jgi:hypothetical protein